MALHSKLPRERREPIDSIMSPFQEFAGKQISGGIMLLVCTVLALIWANSPWQESYYDVWHFNVNLGFGGTALTLDLHHWINDGLMALFFFVVGLEIKRELLAGELSSPRKAALPLAAALGGMVVPVIIFAALNWGGPGEPGWGVPMATDIAFVLGVLVLLGRIVPPALKVFLTALAIVDDIGAVLVIAIFYTAQINWLALALGFAALVLSAVFNTLGVRRPLVYGLTGLFVWIFFLKSGVHATIAGVLLAFTIPCRSYINAHEFIERTKKLSQDFMAAGNPNDDILRNEERLALIHALEKTCERAQTPLQRLEHGLHPWVMFFIMPVFALSNAGVKLDANVLRLLMEPIALGVILGLFVGKTIGISLFSWLAVKMRIAALPSGARWSQMIGLATLGGIGFTMSLFIAGLAFGNLQYLNAAKVGILFGSLIAGSAGFIWLKMTAQPQPVAELAGHVDGVTSQPSMIE